MEEAKMSPEELEEFRAFRRKKEIETRRREFRGEYLQLVNDEVEAAVPELIALSEQMKAVKDKVFENFRAILEMKAEVMALTRNGQRSHTFMNEAGTMRLILGTNCIDSYDDTAEDGIEMVKEYISGLAKDKETKALVDLVLRLLSKDQQGNLKASRILQLKKLADQSGNERFIEGVDIITEAYRPAMTKSYIRLEVKGKNGGWRTIPLSVTDTDDYDTDSGTDEGTAKKQ
jgi:hypothetical protein